MENPVPVQPSEDIPQPFNRKKYLGLSILAGFLYGVPTLLVGFVVSFFILIFFTLIFSGLKIHFTVIVGLAVFMGFVSALVAGITSSLTAHRRSNVDGSPRQVRNAMLSCAGIGAVGLLVFPVLCFAGYALTLRLLEVFNLGGSQVSVLLMGGGESAFFLIYIICIPSIAIVLAYITAILFGGIVYRRLTKKSG